IKPAHEATLEWVFEDAHKTHTPWDSFKHWLHNKAGLYWITGKAGSGKSTLVKFLDKDHRLRASLARLASNAPLIVASYYSWNPGDILQKSQEGLFRTFLLQVFKHQLDRVPTFHQLRRAFEKLVTQTERSVKILLVIDGLDEFEPTDASYTELADMFIMVTQSPNIKAILSSRALSAFEASSADYPKLRLHQLIRSDIQKYVDDRLSGHDRIAELSDGDADGGRVLISEIVSASSGVFLWVRLVVGLLLEGFQKVDALEDLRRKLKTMPRDLDDLFMRMLRQIPEEYKMQSSRIFQIRRFQPEPDGYVMTAFLLYYSEMSLKQSVKASITPITREEQARVNKEIEGRLRSRCAGLFELSTAHGGAFTGTSTICGYNIFTKVLQTGLEETHMGPNPDAHSTHVL
ncbi:hypothetical protein BU23DRAFT_486369, partial [Bimuria novae-zelandiae CBS 107.79]